MNRSNYGFTLMEILLAMSVLIIGLVGILALFPAGLDATRKAIEDTNTAMIAESVYASIRAAAQRTEAGDKMAFFYDAIDDSGSGTARKNLYPQNTVSQVFNETTMLGKTFGIPAFHYDPASPKAGTVPQDIFSGTESNYVVKPEDCCNLGQAKGSFDMTADMLSADQGQLALYSFNIQVAYPNTNPKNLYDITIRVYRAGKLLKKFYTQIMIPTAS